MHSVEVHLTRVMAGREKVGGARSAAFSCLPTSALDLPLTTPEQCRLWARQRLSFTPGSPEPLVLGVPLPNLIPFPSVVFLNWCSFNLLTQNNLSQLSSVSLSPWGSWGEAERGSCCVLHPFLYLENMHVEFEERENPWLTFLQSCPPSPQPKCICVVC